MASDHHQIVDQDVQTHLGPGTLQATTSQPLQPPMRLQVGEAPLYRLTTQLVQRLAFRCLHPTPQRHNHSAKNPRTPGGHFPPNRPDGTHLKAGRSLKDTYLDVIPEVLKSDIERQRFLNVG